MDNPVSLPELHKALEMTAWDMAEEEVKKLPPVLQEDELTPDRFYEKHKSDFSGVEECRKFLDALVEAGRFEKQERRVIGKSGARPVVYAVKQNAAVV